MVHFKSRKLKKRRKNKTRYLKNKTRHLKNKRRYYTIKQSKHKYNIRQHNGGQNITTIVTTTESGQDDGILYFLAFASVVVFIMLGAIVYNIRRDMLGQRLNVQLPPLPPLPPLAPLPQAQPGDVANYEPPLLDTECAICMEAMKQDTDVAQVFNCGHVFHVNCINLLRIQHYDNCPLCRQYMIAQRNIVLQPPPTSSDSTNPVSSSPTVLQSPSSSSLSSSSTSSSIIPSSFFSLFSGAAQEESEGSDFHVGGATALLEKMAKEAKNIDDATFQTNFTKHFPFLKLTATDYSNILALFKEINNDNNLEKLIDILVRGLGFITESDKSKNYTTDFILAAVLGITEEEKIKKKVQDYRLNLDLSLEPEQIIRVIRARNILGINLIKYFNYPDNPQNSKELSAGLTNATTILVKLIK